MWLRSSKRSGQQPCQLVVSDVSGPEGPRLLYILQRWLPLVLTIRSTPQHRYRISFSRFVAAVDFNCADQSPTARVAATSAARVFECSPEKPSMSLNRGIDADLLT